MEASLRLQFANHTDTGRVRQANEDNQGHSEYFWGNVWVVCDGMGGHVGGARASHIAVTSILEFFARNNGQDPADGLRRAVAFANEQIYATALNDPHLKGMGTTCVVLLQKESTLWLAHVGDSRAYIFTDGKLFKLTRDHSFVQRLVDEGAIAEEDAESHPRKNELLRALGIRGDVEVDVTVDPILPKRGDTFLLCSDGLYGMTMDTGIQKVLSGPGTLEEKARLLIDEANAAGGTDNITVSLLHVTDSPHTANRYDAIKPPVNMSRTMPVSQEATRTTAPPPPPHVPIVKKYMIPIVFGITFLLAVGIVLLSDPFGWQGPSEEAEKAKLDSIAQADSLKKIAVLDSLKNDSLQARLADSLRADSIAKAANGGGKPSKETPKKPK